MRRITCTVLLLGCSLAVETHGQGTFQVTFDGPPVQPPGTASLVTNYSEAGMSFTTLPGSIGFGRVGSNPVSFLPDDGSAYIQQTLVSAPVLLNLLNGSSFNMVSVDLAEYSTSFQEPTTVQFIGYYADGSTVTTSFTTDGIIDGTGSQADFQTFLFPFKEWSGLRRVEIPTSGWSLDNLVVSVPEPATWALSFCGAVVFGLRSCWRRRWVRGVPFD